MTSPRVKWQISGQRTVLTVHPQWWVLGQTLKCALPRTALSAGSLRVGFPVLGPSDTSLEFNDFTKPVGLQANGRITESCRLESRITKSNLLFRTLLTFSCSSKWSYSRSFHFFSSSEVKLEADVNTGIVSGGQMMLFHQLDICWDLIKPKACWAGSLDPLKRDLTHQVYLGIQASLTDLKASELGLQTGIILCSEDANYNGKVYNFVAWMRGFNTSPSL